MKKQLQLILQKLGILHYAHIIRENLFPTAYFKNSRKDLKRYKDFYAQFIDENELCFDIGAHRGHRTEVFLQLKARVIAIEPQIDLYKYLKTKYKNQAIIENIGLGGEVTNKIMYISEMSSLSTFSKEWATKAGNRFKDVKWHKGNSVKINTIDNLIKKYGIPKFCKIDVEGYEFEVLKGLSQNIPVISIEYMTPENSEIVKNCLAHLHKLDNKILINYTSGDEMKLCLDNWLEYEHAIEHIRTNLLSQPTWGDIYIKM